MNNQQFKEWYINQLCQEVFPGYLDKWWNLGRPAFQGMSPDQLVQSQQGRDALISLLESLKRGTK